jgi:hypothetical protein
LEPPGADPVPIRALALVVLLVIDGGRDVVVGFYRLFSGLCVLVG